MRRNISGVKKRARNKIPKKKIITTLNSTSSNTSLNDHTSHYDPLLMGSVNSKVDADNLLEQARKQWLFGEWESLTQLDRGVIEKNFEKAKLALLVAAAHQQLNDMAAARKFIKLAKEWGCDKRAINQILISGVYNTLGKAAAIALNDERAQKHFSMAVHGINGDHRLNCQTRSVSEIARLGLLNQAAMLVEKELTLLSRQPYPSSINSQITVLRFELDLLHSELSLAQQRHQLTLGPTFSANKEAPTSRSAWLKDKSVSQLGQDLWVLEKTGYKRGGFFVEFGATDGVLLSNTWLLEKEFDWKGICAEPNPKFFVQLQKNRQCQISDKCIGRETGKQIEFILADAFGGNQEFIDRDQYKAKREAYAEIGEVITLTTISLDDFLKQQNAPRDIDYMSIDTEGSEFDLLSSFPFENWNIRLLTIEHNYSEQREKIRQLLETHNYHRTEQQWDDWYEKAS